MFLQYSVGFTHCNLFYVALLNLLEVYCLTLALIGRKKNSACILQDSPEIRIFPLHVLWYFIASFSEKIKLHISRED